eukprot:7337326-Alexandrium_andersonii.AAC.1
MFPRLLAASRMFASSRVFGSVALRPLSGGNAFLLVPNSFRRGRGLSPSCGESCDTTYLGAHCVFSISRHRSPLCTQTASKKVPPGTGD